MLSAFAFTLALASAYGAPMPRSSFTPLATLAGGDITGTVSDTATHQPLPGADILARQGTRIFARTQTDAFGRFRIHNLGAGEYDVEIHLIGFRPARVHILLGASEADLVVQLAAAVVELQDIQVTAPVPVAVDTRSGDQVFKQDNYHGAPSQTTSQIVQQSVAGSVRAPTGEVHIRGQHAEYTYYIDGIPIPAGISGSLNELFDPNVVNQITFQTGSWDAEFGNKNAAIVDVQTRIPAGGLRGDGSAYVGSFNSNGQTLNASRNAGRFGWFVSGTRQVTDMRREPVVFDTLTGRPLNFHNHGEDLYGFGKLQYLASSNDVFNLNANLSRTRFQVPYDSTGGVSLDDNQQDVNSFVNLGWRHQGRASTAARGADLFVGAFYRGGSLAYVPGVDDDAQFIFFPDTTTPYNVTENRKFSTVGLKADYTYRVSEKLQFKTGALASFTKGHEDFTARDQAGNPGPASNSNLRGSDSWAYAQAVLQPVEKFEIRTGLRFDNHNAPFAGNRHQVSPRIRVSVFPDAQTTLWAYYGRLFIPTNVEDLRAITSSAQGGVAAQPTLPERDHFFELGVVHRFPFGVVAKLSAYRKRSSPGIDDNTVPGSAITTSVNIDQVTINGIESVLEIRPAGRLSGYLNFAINHAYGIGPITGGFFPTDNPSGYFDLDHDQRVSAVATINYADQHAFLSVTGNYGSGLTNGADPDASYGTGLFAFNRSSKVAPSAILSASGGYIIKAGGILLRPEIYFDNLLNHRYLLKGAFFSGPSVGRPRSVQIRMNFSL